MKINKMIMHETLYGYVPVLLSGLFWLFMVITGLIYLKAEFQDNTLYPMIIMVWMILSLSLTKIIAHPVTTYEEVNLKDVKGKRG